MNISTFQSNLDFIKSIYFHEEWKDKKCRDTILKVLEEANEKIEKAFGKSMCKLGVHKPSVEAVEKVAQKFPSTLSYIDPKDGLIPIQKNAKTFNGFEYIPVLVKEGTKWKVGGEDARGGLLTIDPIEDGENKNTLQILVSFGSNDKDAKRLKVLKELQKNGFLLKKDVQEQELLRLSCWEKKAKRFEYLVSLDADSLIETRFKSKPLIHYVSSHSNDQRIILLLKAGFNYHANIGGLLFIKDDHGTTAFDYLCNKKGVEKAMSLLHDIFCPKCDYPLLHHIFVKAPQHKDVFMKKFPWAYHLKDHNGRTLHQAVLAAGANVMNKNDMILASLSDNQIQTKDPITTLYPFAAMAAGEYADLEQCYYLLRRQPSVVDRRSRSETEGSSICSRKKRRIGK